MTHSQPPNRPDMNAQRGGTSTSIYNPSDDGHLRLDDELGSDEQARIKSRKGQFTNSATPSACHTSDLFENDKLGNSLMGPVILAYRASIQGDTSLSHQGVRCDALEAPTFQRNNERSRDYSPTRTGGFPGGYDKSRDRMIVSGKVVSDYGAHSIVVTNESAATRSDYWRKCFAARTAEDGTFEVAINELDHTGGQLRIVCCFHNGAIVGQKAGLGLQTGFMKRYRFIRGDFTFGRGWGPPQTRYAAAVRAEAHPLADDDPVVRQERKYTARNANWSYRHKSNVPTYGNGTDRCVVECQFPEPTSERRILHEKGTIHPSAFIESTGRRCTFVGCAGNRSRRGVSSGRMPKAVLLGLGPTRKDAGMLFVSRSSIPKATSVGYLNAHQISANSFTSLTLSLRPKATLASMAFF